MFHTQKPCLTCNNQIPSEHSSEYIRVHGAKEHNLKNICFQIPKGKLIALTGPSGSGKSTIATDILQKECIRQYLESLGMTTDHLEKADVDSISGLSPSIGVSQKVTDFNSRSTVGTKTGILSILRNMFAVLGLQSCHNCGHKIHQTLQDANQFTTIKIEHEDDSSKKKTISYFSCPSCNERLEKLTMSHFSSSTAAGACNECKGAGEVHAINFSTLLDEKKNIHDGGVQFWDSATAMYYEKIIIAASKHYSFAFDASTAIQNYTPEQRNFLLYGINFPDFKNSHKATPPPKKVRDGYFEGVISQLRDACKTSTSKDRWEKFMQHSVCKECAGSGLTTLGRTATIDGKTIIETSNLDLNELAAWIQSLEKKFSAADLQILRSFSGALTERLTNLIEVGLHYLTLNRPIPSLSGGESQRVRLASLLGSQLTGVLYVLDEPTTGLHPHDTKKLLKTLRKIQEAGNTVLVIEHDPEFIQHVDYIIDMGPGGGSSGGQILACGSPEFIAENQNSITGKYLNRHHKFETNSSLRKNHSFLAVRSAREHNLKNIDVTIPTNQLVVLTGVSGSGKSTFLFDILQKVARNQINGAQEVPGKHSSLEGLEQFDRLVTIDQRTIGNAKSTRSNVATYTKLFDFIRDLFASLPTAKAQSFDASSFSFNTSAQRCENCLGSGVIEIDMSFMPSMEKECPACNGMRFTNELLMVTFKGLSITDVLNLTVYEAQKLFAQEKKITAILDIMRQVELDYLKLGQSTATLSGGEAQRIQLAAELSKQSTKNTLYLLDEPTTGLHPKEIEKLIELLQELVQKGNTVIVIEHNLDVMCQADTIIDFGPGGGADGGTIVAQGTPQEITANKNSLTGRSLQEYISKN